jgi:hypothetical protein
MSDYEQAVFISYAWGGEREEIVNQIYQALQTRGIRIIRDKRDLGYKGSISEFMERIGQGNCVIVVISDKYLRSKNCMFELVEIAENKQFADRIFPVILPDARIYDAVERLDYVDYWEKEKAKLNEKMRSLTDLSNLQGVREELDNYDRFRDKISGLTSTLKDMNTLTPDMHRDTDFNELYTAIEKRMKASLGLAKTQTVPKIIETQYFEPKTICIPAGPFLMGSQPGVGIPEYETPQHEVNLPAYYIGISPVTNSEYEEFVRQTGKLVPGIMDWEGQSFRDGQGDFPVQGVTWDEAMRYCAWISQVTGRKYILPNEAQWEKACRDLYGESISQVLEWTSSLWGEKRIAPDAKYRYPWKNDDRNNVKANRQIRRVVRGYTGPDETGIRKFSARYGRSIEDTGEGNGRHSFRVILIT